SLYVLFEVTLCLDSVLQVRLLVEILWPLFLFVILVAVRTTTKPVNKGQCHYPNKAMPSAGLLPWLQGMMCNIDNPCYNDPTPGETPGQVNNFNNSMYEPTPSFPLFFFFFFYSILNLREI
uniref:Uncharacterized protein n=1 Tax=Oryzias latipes TaxID=8090 RepID=A0A3P9HY66_ORYLA